LQKKKTAKGHSKQKAWNADIQYSTPPWKCASTYRCSYLITTGTFKMRVVWPPSLQPWSHSEQLSPVYLREELAGITHSASAIMKSWWKVWEHGSVHRQ
jgi:hypothetical protein